MAGLEPVLDVVGSLAEQRFWSDVSPCFLSLAFARYPEHSSGSKTCHVLPLESAAPIDIERLIARN